MSTVLGRRQRRFRPRVVGLLSGFLLVVVAVFAGEAAADANTSSGVSRPRATAAGHAHPVVDPGLATTGGTGDVRVIVSVAPGGHDPAVAAVRAVGGAVGADLPLVDGFAATVSHARLPRLAAVPAIRAVTLDRVGQVTVRTYDGAPSASSFVSATGADTSWRAGRHGEGVGVAVIDTGVSPVPDLAGVIQGPDLSGEGTPVDTFGHGTVMGGLIAGAGTRSGGLTGYAGEAPGATLVSVKVAGRDGSVEASKIMQAFQWVAVHARQYNIRVLSLSWGVPSTQDPAVDPIDQAVERLWQQGITVLVAAGNGGPKPGTALKPGDDPLAITVGAYDEGESPQPQDDTLPNWSSRGPTPAGVTKPDIVAPGRTVIAARSPGSAVERDHPESLVGGDYIKGSGTSEATAISAGAAALLIQNRPQLTPDQVKTVLRSTASPLPGHGPQDQGAGRLQVQRALRADPGAPMQQSAARARLHPLMTGRGPVQVEACPGQTTPGRAWSERDVRCRAWEPEAWTGSAWTGSAWTGSAWTGASYGDRP